MIPQANTMTVESTLTGEDVEMAIDNSAAVEMMKSLTRLYSDPEGAAIREYATNAIDAHVEAEIALPIEVTTPTALRPIFTIRDYGAGLNAEDIRNVYSRYGVSTKRTSNKVVGMLGYGCKSALAYADQFTVVGIKEGIRTTIIIFRNERGTGTMKILEETETDEPSGVAVSIRAKSDNRIAEKAAEFFSYWDEGTVLIDNKPAKLIDGYQLTETMMVVERSTSTEKNGLIVMGNVPYPAQFSGVPYQRQLVVRVPIGAVDFVPSREALEDTKRTRDLLEQIEREYEAAAAVAIEREIDKAKSRPDALKAVIRVRSALSISVYRRAHNNPEVNWRGELVPNFILTEDHCPYHVVQDGVGRAAKVVELPVASAIGASWITGFDNHCLNKPMLEKFSRYCQVEGIELSGALIATAAANRPTTRLARRVAERRLGRRSRLEGSSQAEGCPQ